jgi:hypothetical protein
MIWKVVKIHILDPHPWRFWFNRWSAKPRNLHFYKLAQSFQTWSLNHTWKKPCSDPILALTAMETSGGLWLVSRHPGEK